MRDDTYLWLQWREPMALLEKELDAAVPEADRVELTTALEVVRRADHEVLARLAALEIAAAVNAARRGRVLDVERRAETAARDAEVARRRALTSEERREEDRQALRDRPSNQHGVGSARADGCDCELCEEVRARYMQEDEEAEDRYRAKRAELWSRTIADLTRELRMEWTAELLDAGFALPDGAVVRWGDATVEEHTRRRDMLSRNALANAEAAARHEKAIAALNDGGARTLRELLAP